MIDHGPAQLQGLRGSRRGIKASSTLAPPAPSIAQSVGGVRPSKRIRFASIGDSSASGLIIQGSSDIPQELGTDPDGSTPPISGDSLRRPDFPISFSGLGVPKFTSNIRLAGIDGSVGISGNLQVGGGISGNTETISTSQTIDSGNYIVRCTGAAVLTLPDAGTNAGRKYHFTHDATDLYVVTVQAAGSDTIHGTLSSATMSNKYDHLTFISDGGTNWIMPNTYKTRLAYGVGNISNNTTAIIGPWYSSGGSVTFSSCFRAGIISGVTFQIDMDSSYDSWKVLSDTLQLVVKINQVTVHTSPAYAGTFWEANSVQGGDQSYIVEHNLAVEIDVDDMVQVYYTSVGTVSGMEIAAEVVVTHFN